MLIIIMAEFDLLCGWSCRVDLFLIQKSEYK